jgi:hypothetical protein
MHREPVVRTRLLLQNITAELPHAFTLDPWKSKTVKKIDGDATNAQISICDAILVRSNRS